VNIDEARQALNAGDDVVATLRRVWHLLDGADAHGMAGDKLDRADRVTWRDPVVTFELERHAGGDVQHQRWRVDLERGVTACVAERWLRPRYASGPFDARTVAVELARAMRAGDDDPRLEWRDERRLTVKVLTSQALPPGSTRGSPRHAVQLRDALADELGHEWSRDAGVWVRAEAA
jgi:hypothetical protein